MTGHSGSREKTQGRCGDLAADFTRFHCPDCGHEKLLAFTCKSRHFCPACHQRRTRQTGGWIASSVCHDIPHRQFVFTFPKMLRGIFRKRRHLLHLLFQTATECLRDAFRARLALPEGRIAAAAAVHTFGDYLVFHPHLHLFAADGLFDEEGLFHTMPDESLAPITELFRHRFLQILRDEKHLSAQKVTELLAWKHSGFHIDGGEKPVAPGDTKGRQRLAKYLLRAPFSLQKIHWNPKTKTVIYRSRRSWRTKRNFEVFKATDFLAAAIDHIPPRGQQTNPLLRPLLEQEPRHATTGRRTHRIRRRETTRSETTDHPATAQSHRPRHAPALARSHPPRLGRGPAPVPLLQGHHESRGHHLPRW